MGHTGTHSVKEPSTILGVREKGAPVAREKGAPVAREGVSVGTATGPAVSEMVRVWVPQLHASSEVMLVQGPPEARTELIRGIGGAVPV